MIDETWRAVRADVEARLRVARVTSAAVEAGWIVECASGISAAVLKAGTGDHEAVSAVARAHVEQMVARRVAGEPLQYVLGAWSFRGIELYVDPRVLIPRPETEVVAGLAIDEAVKRGARRGRPRAIVDDQPSFVVVDLGTGSGAIALALAAELPEAEVWATDASADALAVARANLAGIGSAATRVRLAEGDWFDALPTNLRSTIRVVVSNPPYVAEHEVDDLPPEVALHEPHAALVSGPTGVEAIARIVADAPQWLEPGGALVVELAPHQGAAAAEQARAAGFAEVRVERDLVGRARALVARVPC